MTQTLMIFGAGFSGKAIAAEALARGWRVIGTTRSPAKAEALARAGIEPLLFDGARWTREIDAALASADALIASVAPDDAGDPVIAAGRGGLLAAPRLAWIGYLSTVGVYGDAQGGWVDEETPLNPGSTRSAYRAAAECEWMALAAERKTPLAILRLSGIYGPGRNALANVAEGEAKRIVKAGQVFNRIHVDDIAGAALFLYQKRAAGAFNVTDDEPAPPQDVVAHAAGLLGAPVPPEIRFEDAALSPMARSFYAENKRVSNAKLKALGFRFRFPDYRAGLAAILAGMGARA